MRLFNKTFVFAQCSLSLLKSDLCVQKEKRRWDGGMSEDGVYDYEFHLSIDRVYLVVNLCLYRGRLKSSI